MQRPFPFFSLLLLPRVLCRRTLQLAQLLRAPDQRYVLLIVQGVHGACHVATHAIFIVPEGALLAVQAQPVVREEVGVLRNRLEVGVYCFIELLERLVACACVGYYRAGRYLKGRLSMMSVGWWTERLVAYIADVWRRTVGFGWCSMACGM
jgi:hypothetical protein